MLLAFSERFGSWRGIPLGERDATELDSIN